MSSVTNKLMITLLLWLLTKWERFLYRILQCLVDTVHETLSYVTESHGSETSGALVHWRISTEDRILTSFGMSFKLLLV